MKSSDWRYHTIGCGLNYFPSFLWDLFFFEKARQRTVLEKQQLIGFACYFNDDTEQRNKWFLYFGIDHPPYDFICTFFFLFFFYLRLRRRISKSSSVHGPWSGCYNMWHSPPIFQKLIFKCCNDKKGIWSLAYSITMKKKEKIIILTLL